MNAPQASQTAVVASLIRALHTRTDPLVIHRDPWGDRLVPGTAWLRFYDYARIRHPALPEHPDEATVRAVVSAGLRASAPYPNIVIRSRYAEDALRRAVDQGLSQYVLIGAGLDSYALRDAESSGITVVEIDHPATQAMKRQCLERAGLELPKNVHLQPADLSVEDLDVVLSKTPLRLSEPIFFSWLGVTMYLSRDANLKTMKAIASIATAGSELVLEYVDAAFFDQTTALDGSSEALRRGVAAMGEPFVSGFEPAQMDEALAAAGLVRIDDVSDVELVQRYDPEGKNQMKPLGFGRLALARVGGPRAG